MDSTALSFASESSRRVLTKKLDVLKLAIGQPKEVVKEALVVATKLQHEILLDLQNCPKNNLQLAHSLQRLYISSVEITLELLRLLDSHGAVMIGQGEFLPNRTFNFRLQTRGWLHICLFCDSMDRY